MVTDHNENKTVTCGMMDNEKKKQEEEEDRDEEKCDIAYSIMII